MIILLPTVENVMDTQDFFPVAALDRNEKYL
jgi:hypothetical protein